MPANSEPSLRLTWEQITAVYAYKRDCVSVDQIRLVLGDDIQQTWMEVSEDDMGGKQLFVELPRHIHGFQDYFRPAPTPASSFSLWLLLCDAFFSMPWGSMTNFFGEPPSNTR